MEKDTILIFGASGGVGSSLAKQLTELTALENAMQMSFSDNPKKKEAKWTKGEENRLEHAFRLAKNIKEGDGKWEFISDIVESRNA
jgi:NADPH:quinone reductase-like Zn-dependent oxidoreductase